MVGQQETLGENMESKEKETVSEYRRGYCQKALEEHNTRDRNYTEPSRINIH